MQLTHMPTSAFPMGSSGAGVALDAIWLSGKGAGFYTALPPVVAEGCPWEREQPSAQGHFLERDSADSSCLHPEGSFEGSSTVSLWKPSKDLKQKIQPPQLMQEIIFDHILYLNIQFTSKAQSQPSPLELRQIDKTALCREFYKTWRESMDTKEEHLIKHWWRGL